VECNSTPVSRRRQTAEQTPDEQAVRAVTRDNRGPVPPPFITVHAEKQPGFSR